MILNIAYPKTWNSSIPDEYKNEFYTYGVDYTTSSIELVNVFKGNSGTYYILNLYNGSSHTMFSMEAPNPIDNWSKQYNFQASRGNSVVLDSAEQYFYNVDNSVNFLFEILKINTVDGDLVANYQQ